MKLKLAALALIPLATAFVLAQEKTVWDGIYTDEQANRGKQLYSDACASCHGPELTGGEMAPPLVGGDFTADWNGLTVGDLFDRIRISMPQNAPGSLTGAQNADVLAFVLQVNKFPAGQTELAKDAMMLKAIKFDTKKPGD
jgi:mono/diheme cytochrome c family protein